MTDRATLMLMMLPGLVIGLTLHEFAHAWSASLLGDQYSRRMGRVSLNPLRHLSPLGTLAIFVVYFGWGKPVPINLYNFKRPRCDYLIVSLAGPAANGVIIFICLALMQLTRQSFMFGDPWPQWTGFAHLFLELMVLINAILAVLNLLPIPPLDGSKIWPILIPALKPAMGGRKTYLFIFILLALMFTGSLSPLFSFVADAVMSVTPDSDVRRYDHKTIQGYAFYNHKQYALALADFQEAAAIYPGSDSMDMWLGLTLCQLTQYDEALPYLNRAIELYPNEPVLYEWRSYAFYQLGRYNKAANDQQKLKWLDSQRNTDMQKPDPHQAPPDPASSPQHSRPPTPHTTPEP